MMTRDFRESEHPKGRRFRRALENQLVAVVPLARGAEGCWEVKLGWGGGGGGGGSGVIFRASTVCYRLMFLRTEQFLLFL